MIRFAPIRLLRLAERAGTLLVDAGLAIAVAAQGEIDRRAQERCDRAREESMWRGLERRIREDNAARAAGLTINCGARGDA